MTAQAVAAQAVAGASPEVLAVDDLHVRFPVRDERGRRTMLRAVSGVSFSIARGETLALVGESGCGKSTLVRTLFGLNPIAQGSIRVLGHDLGALPARRRQAVRNRMQMVFQDPYSALDPRLTAGEIISEPLRIAGRHDRAKVVQLAASVGLDADALDRRPGAFSGGQRQRIGIARALALEPDVLVLDEPVSALDVSVQAQVINLLAQLQADLGLSYLFIAHDLSVVRHLSHRVAVMHLGALAEIGTRDQIFSDPQHPYTRSLLSAIPVPDPRLRERRRVVLTGELPNATQVPAGCTFSSRCPVTQPGCNQAEPPLRRSGTGRSRVACFHPEISQEQIPLLGPGRPVGPARPQLSQGES
jgi:oligopeptide transport system ATP-binding protein